MNFELGKKYIVAVTKKGIIPLSEFDDSKWYNKDYDDLDFLTDEEKKIVINKVLYEVKAEIDLLSDSRRDGTNVTLYTWEGMKRKVFDIIDKCKAESEVEE